MTYVLVQLCFQRVALSARVGYPVVPRLLMLLIGHLWPQDPPFAIAQCPRGSVTAMEERWWYFGYCCC